MPGGEIGVALKLRIGERAQSTNPTMNLQIAGSDERPTGAAMDAPIPRRRVGRAAFVLGTLTLLGLVAFAAWRLAPRGLVAPLGSVRIAIVEAGMFRDDVVFRATAAPLHSVMLDAVESGRVEEVFARDGAIVKPGELLFRLSNPQRRLELLAREAEHAQQISNLTNLRVSLEASRTARQRRASDLAFAVQQAEKQHARNVALAQKGFVSPAMLEDSADHLAQQRRLLATEQTSNAVETATQADAVRQMEQAIARLDAGMRLVGANVEALAVRAPVAGRLTDFHLQVGEAVKPDQRVGRIDDIARVKLSAGVDEYYLNRVATGLRGSAIVDGTPHAVAVSRIYPQISEGRFTVELAFEQAQPASMNPGRSVEASLTLGGAKRALLLPNDAFVNDGGGQWAFVLDREGYGAARRAIRTGRRNNGQVEVLSGLSAGERVIVSTYARYGGAERLQLAP